MIKLIDDIDPTSTVGWLLDDPHTEIISVSETYLNKSYDPQEWERLFNEICEFIAKAGKTGFRVY